MILADENIPKIIIESLRDQGFEVFSVIESARGINDQQVIELALQYDYLLLTEDKDFGEWVFSHHVKDLTVIFLRYSFFEYKQIAKALIYFLKTDFPKRPFFATVTAKKVRIRQL